MRTKLRFFHSLAKYGNGYALILKSSQLGHFAKCENKCETEKPVIFFYEISDFFKMVFFFHGYFHTYALFSPKSHRMWSARKCEHPFYCARVSVKKMKLFKVKKQVALRNKIQQ